MPNVKVIDEDEFQKAIETKDRLVIVEFYLPTCPSCRAIAPVYGRLSDEFKDQALSTMLDAGTNPGLVQRFGVMSTPTFKFFCNGKPIGELVGAVNETMLRNTIKDFIKHRQECTSNVTPLPIEIDGYG